MQHTRLICHQAVKKKSTGLDRLRGKKMTFGQECQMTWQSHQGISQEISPIAVHKHKPGSAIFNYKQRRTIKQLMIWNG